MISNAPPFVPATSTAPTAGSDVLDPVVARYRGKVSRIYFRADAAFAMPGVYEFLEDKRHRVRDPAPRQPGLAGADRSSAQAPGRASAEPSPQVFFASFRYQAGELEQAAPGGRQGRVAPGRAVPARRLHRHQPEPAGRAGRSSSTTGRGTAEQWIKEGKSALRWTRLSCHAFRHNAVRLQLHALAYNLANFLRSLALPAEVEHWSLTTLREKLVKIGATDRAPRRYLVFQLAEVARAAGPVRRDPAPDRSAQTRAAPGMSWVAAMRGSRQRRCVHDQRRPAHTRPERRSQSAKDRFGARSALLPMRSGLPAAPGGRKLDRQRPASGKCRVIGLLDAFVHGQGHDRPRRVPGGGDAGRVPSVRFRPLGKRPYCAAVASGGVVAEAV